MKSKIKAFLFIMSFSVSVIFLNCAGTRSHDFSLKNTVSIFLLNNGKNNYFCIPVQYTGDYNIENFEFDGGYVQIGGYKLILKRDELNIYAYLNEEATDPFGISTGEFILIYSQENGDISISKMHEPPVKKHSSDEIMNHYYIFIERHLKNDEMKKIIKEYERGNFNSQFFIEYDITIDNELQSGSGIYDDFELFDGPAEDYTLIIPNLEFFRAKYLLK